MEPKRLDTTIRVAVVDDDEDFRLGLQWLLDNSEGYACTGVFRNCAAALKEIDADLPDVVLMDIGMPGKSGIECVGALKEIHPSVQVIMQTVYSDDEKIFQSLRAGAVGYILKKSVSVDILQAISDAYAGGAPMSGEIARKVLSFFRNQPAVDEISNLSGREIDVLELLIEGHSYKVIAKRLFVSVHTVRFHLHNIYEKLHVSSRGEAVAKMMRHKRIE